MNVSLEEKLDRLAKAEECLYCILAELVIELDSFPLQKMAGCHLLDDMAHCEKLGDLTHAIPRESDVRDYEGMITLREEIRLVEPPAIRFATIYQFLKPYLIEAYESLSITSEDSIRKMIQEILGVEKCHIEEGLALIATYLNDEEARGSIASQVGHLEDVLSSTHAFW